ncbi:MAG: DUF2442 domain-containing protein [Pyrinomonadaceae bacterium]
MAEEFDEEFEREYQEATRRGEEALRTEPRAKKAFYDAKKDRVVIELLNDCTFIVPPRLVQGLRDATREQLSNIRIMPFGFALDWTDLDVQHEVKTLLRGMFGNKRWMAQIADEANGKSRRPSKKVA